MSVPQGKRGVSKLEFLNKAYYLNDRLTQLLLHDFGVKPLARDLRSFTYRAKMTEEDAKAYTELCKRYNIDVEASYPLWLLTRYRDRILDIMDELIANIVQANSIYPAGDYFEHLFIVKRDYQQKAIANCYNLLQCMQTAGRNLPVDYNRFMPFVDIINEELQLLKAWKKSGNKLLENWKKNK